MQQSELEDFILVILAAADPHATADNLVKFKLGWANYEAAFPVGIRPLTDAAVACGFERGKSDSPNTLSYVKACLKEAREKCAKSKPRRVYNKPNRPARARPDYK